MSGSRDTSIALSAETLLAHSAWLTRLARALVASDDDIDDVVQQTYLQALTKPPRHTENLRAWLATIARNVVRSKSRSNTSRAAREVAVPLPPPIEDPAEAVERAELRQLVVEAVLVLDEPYRSSLILRFFEEMDVDAIGRMMGSGDDTVRTRIRRGVIRVRELLERQVREKSRDSVDGGAAAVAVMFARLRRVAAGGGGGNTATATVLSRGTMSGRGIRMSVGASRRILVGAAAVAVVAGGWWWTRAPRSTPRDDETHVARGIPVVDNVPRPAPAAVAGAVERSADAAPPTSPSPPSEIPRIAEFVNETGIVRGIITGPDGNPVAGANVWAIASPSFEAEMDVPAFGTRAAVAADRKAKGTETANWFGTMSGADGRYEIVELARVTGWVVGAYEQNIGAMLSDVCSFDHEHGEASADLKLIPGREVSGVVRDASLAPLGTASVTLFTTIQGHVTQSTVSVRPMGASVGEFYFGFQCGEPLEFLCSAAGFEPGVRRQVPFTPNIPGVRLKVTMKRKPGTVVRGRIVDPSGRSVAPSEILLATMTTAAPEVQPLMLTVRAIPEVATPAAEGAGQDASEVVDGGIDFVHRMYDLVLPESFRGHIELSIAGTAVGTAPLLDLANPPDLPCDVHQLPKESAPTIFVARFVDAESKQPIEIDVEKLPSAYYGNGIRARNRSGGSNASQGVIAFGCNAGELTIEATPAGFAPGIFHTIVPEGGRVEPQSFELERSRGSFDGVVLHTDGRPFGRAKLTLYRATPSGLVDVTGTSTASNPDGRFRIPRIAKGEHVLVASGAPDESPGVTRFIVQESSMRAEVQCRIGVPVTLRVAGDPVKGAIPNTRFTILDGSGIPLEDSHRAWPPESHPLNDFRTVLPEGRYTVVVRRDGFREARVEFGVPTADAILVPIEPLATRSK